MAATSPKSGIPSGSTAKLSIIDTGAWLSGIPTAFFFGPPVDGFEVLPPRSPTWSFFIETSTGRRAVFDLGLPKNLEDLTPVVLQEMQGINAVIEAPKNVSDVLIEGGIALESIESIIWSHYHLDHIGNPSTFPSSTEVVVGPRAKEVIFPTYPERQDSPIHENLLKGKSVREISFDGGLKFYGLDAVDFFGDGSFYLIGTPGHTLGHISGLVRTTSNPDTFVVLGGDMFHSAGELRPSNYKPLPKDISFPDTHQLPSSRHAACPCAFFENLQAKRGRAVDEPFFEVTAGHDVEAANDSLKKSLFPDAQEDILYLSAHDDALPKVVKFFPDAINDWKDLGWKEKLHWDFLRHLTNGLVEKE